jgi:hypothetical protein
MQNSMTQLYTNKYITIWHKASDCEFFIRAKDGNKETLNRIVKRYESEFKDLFDDEGEPRLSTIGIGLNLFKLCAWEHFNHSEYKTKNFMRKNLYEIMLFVENTIDSLHTSIISNKLRVRYFASNKQDKINEFAYCIYGWVLRADRSWYRNPRWHIHHWCIQIHPWQTLRRYLFTRCAHCGKSFHYGESPHCKQWDNPKPKIFKSEVNVYHKECIKELK